jgi:mannitol operon repressor
MRVADAEDLANFVGELRRETDRGLPLVGAALIDDRLEETLRAFFCEGRPPNKLLDEANAPLGTLSSRTQACYVLGLIDEFEYLEIELIRKVRNELAHAKHGTSFQTEKVKGLCSSLRSDLPEGAGHPTGDPRFRFINAVVCVVLRLYYRPEWVALERRQPKKWLSEDATRWRSIHDEKPPSGVPVPDR